MIHLESQICYALLEIFGAKNEKNKSNETLRCSVKQALKLPNGGSLLTQQRYVATIENSGSGGKHRR